MSTVYNVKIQNDANAWYAFGDAFSVVRDVTDLAAGTTIDKAWLTVKSDPTAEDEDAELQLVITGTASDDGQITDDGDGETTGEVTFTFAVADHYANLVADLTYQFDIQLKLSDQELPTTLEAGTIRWNQDVTRATS